MATRSNSDEQRNLKALKLLRSRAEALDASFQRVFTRSWAMSWSTGSTWVSYWPVAACSRRLATKKMLSERAAAPSALTRPRDSVCTGQASVTVIPAPTRARIRVAHPP